MYNQYLSPAALVQLYSDAGLNPRLAINSSSVGRVSASSGSSGGAPCGTHVNPMGYPPPYMDTKGFASSFGEIANALKSLSEAKKNGIDTEYLEDEWKQKLKSYKLSNAAQELLNSVNLKYLDKQQKAILDKFAVEIANGKLTYSELEQQINLLKKENVIKQNDVDHWLERFSADLDATHALPDNYRASADDSYASVSLKKVQEGLVLDQENLFNEQALTESLKRDLLSSTEKMQDLVSKTHQLELDIRNGAKIAEIRSRRMSLRKLYWESKRDLQRARYAFSSEYLSDDTYSYAVKPTNFNEFGGAFNSATNYVRSILYP